MFRRGDFVTSVLSGETGKIFERFGPSTNPHYRDYVVIYPNHKSKVVRERHLRKAMRGEERNLTQPLAPEA